MQISPNPDFEKISKKIRYLILQMSTLAASGHPTSSLSATDLMSVFFSKYFRYDFKNPKNPTNDRLIFSKGHASPLYYALFMLADVLKEEDVHSYRTFTSNLEGHPTFRFPYAEAATGSLGQGLSIGVGCALNGKYLDKSDYMTVVLLGDGEMAEGSVWEALALSGKYKLNNLTAILDVNRLGQSEATMLEYDLSTYQKRVESFGWATKIIDGHDFRQIEKAYEQIGRTTGPYMIIAKTIKGKGVSFLEDKLGWHGKPLPQDQYEQAIKELGDIDTDLKISVKKPPAANIKYHPLVGGSNIKAPYKLGDKVATRKAYGEALAFYGRIVPNLVVLDGEVKNSTFAEIFKAEFPTRFFEMYIAEQNMMGAAIGLSKMGKIPFASTFAAFLTRAYDQIRMGVLSGANIKICGSHAGVSIGEDGPSQMGLEDLSMFRTIQGCFVVYPSDATSTFQLVGEMIRAPHMGYMRTTRPATPVIYAPSEKFPIGGCKIHRISKQKTLRLRSGQTKNKEQKKVLIIGAGVTFFEALKAQEELIKKNIEAIVVDCYSVKPIDGVTLRKLAKEARNVIVVEDHWYEGGLGDAVLNELINLENIQVKKLAVSKLPRSGKPDELMDFEGISAKSIVREAVQLVK
ncbi:transketolase [Candidatus Gottesmanbacteria bacterium]|nr:transketolase [Candidatus Gottesmanbacteria bacterium]